MMVMLTHWRIQTSLPCRHEDFNPAIPCLWHKVQNCLLHLNQGPVCLRFHAQDEFDLSEIGLGVVELGKFKMGIQN